MAIYHLRASVISRSQGRSATASAAYRAAERITDERTGLTFDYAARGGVEHTEILAPVRRAGLGLRPLRAVEPGRGRRAPREQPGRPGNPRRAPERARPR